MRARGLQIEPIHAAKAGPASHIRFETRALRQSKRHPASKGAKNPVGRRYFDGDGVGARASSLAFHSAALVPWPLPGSSCSQVR